MTQTLADRFCADEKAMVWDAPYAGGITYSWDDGTPGGGPTWEAELSDGSHVCSVEAGPCEPRRLREDEMRAA